MQVAPRTPDAAQLLELQRGELEFFKTIVYRYEVAWEETDLQSMIELRDGLLKLMIAEVKQLEEKTGQPKSAIERLAQERACLKKIEAAPLNTADPAFGKQAELNSTAYKDFIKLMEDDFREQAAALRQ